MKCPRCQHESPQGARFCEECATPLARMCSNCGTALSAAAKFCHACAHPVAARAGAPSRSPETYTPKHLADKILTSKAALEGERKQVTVLFADLKGSMELLADRDPEEARKILDPVLELMMEAVHRYEGTVNQVMGDGIMALFGAPVAHEDHAVRACYAALRMQRRVNLYADDIQRRGGTPVQIRVGLNSGEVVVRAIGSDLHVDYTAVGQTTHLAARMEQMAKPGSTLLTSDALKLAEGYVQVKALGTVSVKGLESVTPVYELTGTAPVRSRVQAGAARGLTRFVGRESEFQQLGQALDRAAAGHGQVVAVVGEAGVGKSRLVWECTRSHRTQGWLVLESGAVSYGKATPYLPVVELLKGYCRIQERDEPREIRERVAGKLLMLDRALEPLLTPLLALLDAPIEDSAWDALDPPQRRRRILDAVKRLLLRESQGQPLMVVFEDLQWIDSETQALLDSLVESVPTARMLLLVNYRSEYEHRWGGKTYYTRLRLDPLPPESAEELLQTLLGNELSLIPLARLLIERTEGNPFFLEESVRTLVETGVLAGERGSYQLAKCFDDIRVPATVQAVLAARIDRLPAEEKALLQLGAVIGKDVPFTLLQAVAEEPEADLQRHLAHLQAAEFLYETSLFPDLEYTFKHALTHEVAYGNVLQERRRVLHARIVETIERIHSDRAATEYVEQIAHHASRGEMWEKAVFYFHQAGARALARSAYREAAKFLEEALEILTRLPDTRDRLAQRLELRVTLGPALMAIRGAGGPEVEASYTDAHELCRRLDDSSHLFSVLWGLWYVNHSRGHYERACQIGEQLLALADKQQDPGLLLEADHSLWSDMTAMGRPVEADGYIAQGLRLYDRREHGSYASLYGNHDPGVCGRTHAALTCWLRGFPNQAVTRMHEGLRLATELSHPVTTMIAHYGASHLFYQRGDWREAEETAETMVALGREQGISGWPEHGEMLLGRLRIEQGRNAEGLARLEQAFGPATAVGWTRFAIFSALLLADGYRRTGQPDKGLEILGRLATRGTQGLYEPELARLEGELRLAQSGDPDAAEICFRRAAALARERHEKSFELRAATSLARVLVIQGRREEARAQLDEVYGWFSEGFDTNDLQQTRALQDELM